MKLVRTLWTLFAATSLGRLENGEALRNRGQKSLPDMRVDRKVTRRISKHATRRLLNGEIMRNEDQDGTDIVTDNFANGEEEVVDDEVEDVPAPVLGAHAGEPRPLSNKPHASSIL